MVVMESIFDFKPGKDELMSILGYAPDKEDYLALPMDEDHHASVIYSLFVLRNDEKTAQKYLNKIKDKQLRFDTQLNDVVI
jgi:hypothetical protein